MKYWSKCVFECTVCIPFCEKHQSNFQTSAYSKYCALLRIHQEGNVNTLRPRQDGRHFSDDVFKCIYFNENAWISIKILLKFCSQDSNDGLVNWCIYASLGLNELNASGSSHYCHRTIFFLKWISHIRKKTLRFSHCNSNLIELSFWSHLNSNKVIPTKFCTWHDSCAVVACAKICCDLMASYWIKARWIFHRIWIASKNPYINNCNISGSFKELMIIQSCLKFSNYF